jgi:hypothetical protein
VRTIILRVFKHFSSADRLEHAGYLCCVAIAEHTLVRVLALLILCGLIGYAVLRHE